MEPPTAGMAIGPGAGPEALTVRPEPQTDAEVVLQMLVDVFQDEDAFQMLSEMRGQAQAPAPGMEAPGMMPLDNVPQDIAVVDETMGEPMPQDMVIPAEPAEGDMPSPAAPAEEMPAEEVEGEVAEDVEGSEAPPEEV